jgi:anti-sigma factor RsiW
MNCNEWEERIALYAGGDLPPVEAPAVERHLAECAACQVLLSGLRHSAGLLREAHGEPLEPAHYAAVRARVLSELARGRRPWWAYALAAAAAMLLLVAVWPRLRTVVVNPPPPQPVPVAQALMPAANAAGGADPQVPAQRAPRRPRPAASGVTRAGRQEGRLARRAPSWTSAPPIPEPEPPAQPLVVKLITDDPNVVIYWITEGKGE